MMFRCGAPRSQRARRRRLVAGVAALAVFAPITINRVTMAAESKLAAVSHGAIASASATRVTPPDPVTPPTIIAPAPGTPTQPPTTPSSGSRPSFGGCNVFPADYVYNTPVTAMPAHSDSQMILQHSDAVGYGDSAKRGLQFSFWSEPSSGIHPVVVPANQPLVPITYDQYPQESHPGPFPIPLQVTPEDNTDKHIVVVQQDTCQLFELYATHRSTDGWYAGTGTQWNMNVDDAQPFGWTSANAAGLPILPGLLRYDEVASGHVDHALGMIVGASRKAVVAPATHLVGQVDSSLLPFGARLRLRSDFDTSAFTGQSKVIAEALKTYGMILVDNGPNWMIEGVGDSRWNDTDMNQIRNIPFSALEYVDSGPVTTG